MGFGFLESVYEKCLMIELRKQGLKAESQKPITVRYDGEVVGEFAADIVVEDTIVLEIKSVRRIVLSREIQLVNHLVATGKPVGLVLNFAETKVDVKRKVKELLTRPQSSLHPTAPRVSEKACQYLTQRRRGRREVETIYRSG